MKNIIFATNTEGRKNEMKTQKLEIWNIGMYDDERVGILVPTGKIKQKVYLGDEFLLPGIPTKDINKLNKAIGEYENDIYGYYDLTEFLKSMGYEGIEPIQEDMADYEEMVVFDLREMRFFDLLDYEPYEVYQYFDGSNWKIIEKNDGLEAYEIVIDLSKRTSLDIWDGSNFCCGGRFAHQDVYPILELDGETVNRYLLEFWTQWQGDHPVGCILTEEELREHIFQLNSTDDGDRDPEEIIKNLK